MKSKISQDTFFYMIIVSILPIFLIYLLNATLLDTYSLTKKKQELHEISKILTEGEEKVDIPRLKRESNVEIYFINIQDPYEYRIDPELRDILEGSSWNNMDIGDNIQILHRKDQGINLLVNVSKVTNQLYLLITTPVSSVEKSVRTSREFYYYSFFLAAFLSLLVSYIFSKRVSNPIIRLEKSARNIAELDFSEKLEIKTGNELESLGNSINIMSEKLKSTIENLKELNMQLEIELKNEKKLEIMRRNFISSVNHELKTPLALMRVYAEGLLEGVAEEDEIEEYCDTIVGEVENMEKIVKELLYFSEVEAGYKEPEISPFRIDTTVKKITEKFTHDFKEKNVQLKLSMDESVVCGDVKLVDRVIENFLSNAITYVPQNGIIKISSIRERETVRISVFNNGDNIPQEKIDDIWKPFFKLDQARNRKYGGTGLGLSIVEKILELHRSDYGALNLKDGVEFFFTLPVSE